MSETRDGQMGADPRFDGSADDGSEPLPVELRLRAEHELLVRHGFARVRDLSDRFGVSTVTIRHDLQQLEERQLARRVHGGAMPAAGSRIERSFEEVMTVQADQKAAIARAAADLITSGESLLLDVGTTTAALADELVARRDLADLTVFTNGLKIALALEAAHPRFAIVVTGGTLRPKQHSLVEPLAAPMLDSLRVDTVFIGCNGVDADGGVTNINLPEAAVKRSMIGAAARCVVVADSNKLGSRALASVCAIDDVDVVITDRGADADTVDAIRSKGVDVIIAE
ncbi:MAG: DeoR/GlpR family DNA-binding transcription regulator [Ilumatobacteraceae bacterium]|nr:DeoR/GlpR family DNA-binding transcription regulator [Ilumatobacteraceae bacterium]